MAKLAYRLISDNKSVLVTALTNQALMELAKKDDLRGQLKAGNISKTSLTVDESKELPALRNNKENLCNASPGKLSLATFYVSSGWAKESEDTPFDYVIVDEASQALLPMLGASVKLGKQIIWIGDQCQLAPIVKVNEETINKNNWISMVKGFDTICKQFKIKSYMFCDSFRLTRRGAECTGLFYNNQLRSVSDVQFVPFNNGLIHKDGGPVILNIEMRTGDKIPLNAFERIFCFVEDIFTQNPKTEIAILSKFRETVSNLQKFFILNWNKTAEIPDNVRIETVDRVQGLTVDFCVFLIPKSSLMRSLDEELFNVATSRAKYNTVIFADMNLIREKMPEKVRDYLVRALEFSK